MAKKTLLEIVQDILNDLESDEVNSINDTVEALQIAQIVRSTYEALISGRDWPHLNELFQLDSGTVAKPTHMKLPETILNISWVKYNKRRVSDTKDKVLEVEYKTPEDFLTILEERDSSASNVTVVTDDSGISLNIVNNFPPSYYTTFDNEYLVFDSFDSALETNLQNSKTSCYGQRDPTFTVTDGFIPDLPVQMFPYLQNEAKSTAFLVLKQMPNQKAEQYSVTQRRRMSQEAWRVKNGITYPNYGRKS